MAINTGIGTAIGIPFNKYKRSVDKPYIPPELLSVIRGVWIADQNTNESPNRNIIKNKIKDSGGDFEIINASYTEGSGYKDGAFITDGVSDYIYSQKPVSEMMTNGNDITVISMIVNLDDTQDIARTNFYGTDTAWSQTGLVKEGIDKFNIVGYSKTGYNTSNINKLSDILGDRDDWLVTSVGDDSAKSSVEYSVQGYRGLNLNQLRRLAKVAWYWTVIINKYCTIDEVHMIIEYFNLDKYIRPEIYWDVAKQTLTNNTPDVDWYLKDFSGNNRNGQLNNFAKKLNSGVGLYHEDFTSWGRYITSMEKTSSYVKVISTEGNRNGYIIFKTDKLSNAIKVKISGIPKGKTLRYSYYIDDQEGVTQIINIKEDGIYDVPGSVPNITSGYGFQALQFGEDWIGLTIEQIPDYKDYIVTDGIEDFIRNEEVLNLKDYTFAINRVVLKDYLVNKGRIAKCGKETYTEAPFLFESYDDIGNLINVYSFGAATNISKNNYTDAISYMTKYYYMNQALSIGAGKGIGEGITIGSENNVGNFIPMAMKWMLLFKYSLSSFLLNRQFRKFNLIEKDTVKFLPIIDNNDYVAAEYYTAINGVVINVGNYFPKGYSFVIKIQLSAMKEITKCTFQDKDCVVTKTPDNDISSSTNNTYYIECVDVQTYAQMIHIETENVLRFEDIRQPYPCIFRFYDKHTNEKYDYGSYIKKGSVIKVDTITILLPELYNVNGYVYDGHTYSYTEIKNKEFIVDTDNLIFKTNVTYKLGNPPKVIYSIKALPLTNDIYKYLGYIPDLSGNNNHGYLYNIGYIAESGLDAANKVFSLDGVSDYIRINNLKIGGRQILLNFDFLFNALIFDERYNSDNNGAIYVGGNKLAHNFRNVNGNTYINGELNTTIVSMDLRSIKHIAIVTNPLDINVNSTTPVIGANKQADNYFSKTKFDTFMLFDEIDTAENIKQLNDIVDSIGRGVK